MVRAYEEEIKKERDLIIEVRYSLNKSTCVSVGLIPCRGLIPVVTVMGRQKCCITFAHYDWQELLSCQYQEILEHLKNVNKREEKIPKAVQVSSRIYPLQGLFVDCKNQSARC